MKTNHTSLKSTLGCFVVAITAFLSMPQSSSAYGERVDISGWQNWWRSGYTSYYSAVYMSGRYSRFGSGRYWRSGYYQSAKIAHLSSSDWSRTGSLSHEFWAMYYYNGSSGFLLRTRGLSPLSRGWSYSNVKSSGALRKVSRTLYPSNYIVGKTNVGWRSLDRFPFSKRAWF